MIVSEGGEDLSDLISERGIEIEQETDDFIIEGHGLDSDNHGSKPPEALVDKPESKPHGFRACMSAELRRPPASEPLTRLENRGRFREAVLVCKRSRKEGGQQEN